MLTGEDRHAEGNVPNGVDGIRKGVSNRQIEIFAGRESDPRISHRIRPVVDLKGASKPCEVRLDDHNNGLDLFDGHALADEVDHLAGTAAKDKDGVRARSRPGERQRPRKRRIEKGLGGTGGVFLGGVESSKEPLPISAKHLQGILQRFSTGRVGHA